VNDTDEFLRSLQRRGYTIRLTKRRGHYRITTKDGHLVATAPGTSSSRADLRAHVKRWEKQRKAGAA
jgi:hypothetical protein